jgi:biotin carboxylase
MTRVLLVGARDSSVEYLDDDTIVLDLLQSPERLTERQRARADRVVLVDLADMGAARMAAAQLYAAGPFDGVTAFHEHYLELAARIAGDLLVAGNPLRAVRATRDKATTRAAVGDCGLRNPEYAVARTPGELAEALVRIGYPSVLKPLDGAGSAGVRVLHGPADLDGTVPPAEAAPVLLESYVDGRELSVETLSVAGVHEVVMITEKLVTRGRYRVELGHQAPARLSPYRNAELARATCGLLDRVGHRTGPAHTEIRLNERGAYLIETHTRYGGDRIWEMAGLITGRYPQPATVTALVDRPAPRRAPVAKAAAIRFVTARPGAVVEVTGLADARSVPGVYRVEVDAAPGRMVGTLASSDDRLGHVLALGDTVGEAVAAARRALCRVRVRTE